MLVVDESFCQDLVLYKGKKVSVIVPAHNEARFIEDVVRTVPYFVDFIIAVDDCSTDSTLAKLSRITDKRLRIVHHTRRSGVGAAIMSGHRAAMRLGSDVNVVMAGDGQMDPASLPALLEPLVTGKYDFSKGNRFSRISSLRGMPPLRVVGNIILTLLTQIATGYWRISDSQNGYTAINTNVLRHIYLTHMSDGYLFENDLLIRLAKHSCRIVDIPIPTRYVGRESKIKLTSYVLEASVFLLRSILSRYYHANHSAFARTKP